MHQNTTKTIDTLNPETKHSLFTEKFSPIYALVPKINKTNVFQKVQILNNDENLDLSFTNLSSDDFDKIPKSDDSNLVIILRSDEADSKFLGYAVFDIDPDLHIEKIFIQDGTELEVSEIILAGALAKISKDFCGFKNDHFHSWKNSSVYSLLSSLSGNTYISNQVNRILGIAEDRFSLSDNPDISSSRLINYNKLTDYLKEENYSKAVELL